VLLRPPYYFFVPKTFVQVLRSGIRQKTGNDNSVRILRDSSRNLEEQPSSAAAALGLTSKPSSPRQAFHQPVGLFRGNRQIFVGERVIVNRRTEWPSACASTLRGPWKDASGCKLTQRIGD